jgi:hypothetical protein
MQAITRCKNVRVACVKVVTSTKIVARHENITRHKNRNKV